MQCIEGDERLLACLHRVSPLEPGASFPELTQVASLSPQGDGLTPEPPSAGHGRRSHDTLMLECRGCFTS